MAEPRLGREWLSRLQAGDEVIVRSIRAMGNTGTIVKVSKLTNTQVVIDRGNYTLRFRKDDGYEVGGESWGRQWIEEATPNACAVIHEENKRVKAIRLIEECDLKKLPTAALESIVAAINAARKEGENGK